MKLFSNLFDGNARDIKRYNKIVEQVTAKEAQCRALSEAALAARTADFKQELENGAGLNDILVDAFAVVREASRRVLGMRHFDVQLLGGMVLHDGRIAEMKTGEGKTLVATAPVYLNALSGKGVHVVTVNDYLARRDSEWMGQLYRFLGLSVGLAVHDMTPEEKRVAYAADITYGTNNEFGFDYLRDNMAVTKASLVQRELNYAIVDEVDSILIDEARTPLIISGSAAKPTEMYHTVAAIIPRLKAEEDYTVDEKARTAVLTETGVERVEKLLGVDNLYDGKNTELSHHVNQALKAHTLFKRDRDYVVKDREVIIVDEFTGRLMFGRRYSDGLHQAIEAKEKVEVARESQTLASITFQNYFRLYQKLAGMTGTAATEEDEFRTIYNLDVVVVPTNKPMIREDAADVVYRSAKGKFEAVADEIQAVHATGQPVLVGTVSIEKSEKLSALLKRRAVPHQVLNAKFHEQEAEIVAQAGRKGAVTIATNMAGRGTDIMLGGSPDFLAKKEVSALEEAREAEGRVLMDDERQSILAKYKEQVAAEHAEVVALGGLHIIGTERHESRRIDNQLRGRAGRQGDPGSSRFYLSMEDDLVRHFGGDNIAGIMDKMKVGDDMPIDNALVTKSIESAQKRVEARNFDIRRSVLDYDDVTNQQRTLIYEQRRRVLDGEDLKDTIEDMIEQTVQRITGEYSAVSDYPEEWDLPALLEAIRLVLPEHEITPEDLKALSKDEVPELFLAKARERYTEREELIGTEQMRRIERLLLLRAVDLNWMDELDALDQLRQGIGLQAYGQKSPLVEFKFQAYDMYEQMLDDIRSFVVRNVMRVRELDEETRTMVIQADKLKTNRDGGAPSGSMSSTSSTVTSTGHTVTGTNRDSAPPKRQPYVKPESEKIGRNDQCPCGSGKKYKNCCGRNK